jgi:hypothetical protein
MGSNVGTYTITPFGGSAANYGLAYVPGTLSINPAALTITADGASRAFGVANPAFSATYTGLVNGDTSAVVTGLTLTTPAILSSPVGSYAIVPAAASASNYAISFANGLLSVGGNLLTITADNLTALYGAAIPAFTATYTGFINGDTSAVVTGLRFISTGAMGSSVGNYTITPFGAAAANYAISYLPGTLSITAAAIAIQNPLTITANNSYAPYGAAIPAFTASYAGLVNGDTSAVVTGLQFSSAGAMGSNVGSYTITPFGAAADGYLLAYAPGTLTIGTAQLTITANNSYAPYGAAIPAFTANYAGLVNGDNSSVVTGLRFSSTGAMGSNVGAYAIIPFGAVATNYNLAYAPGVLAINPAALTYVAAPAARLYGATNPIFNGTITGFVNGDTEANATSGTLTFLSPSVAASYVGAYAINGSGLSANHGNYVFVQTPGNATALTITPATLAYAATPVSRLYGAANGVFGGTVIGFVNGDTQAAATSGSLAFTSPGLAASNVGSYPITGAGLTANHGNYVFIQTAGNRTALTINPAPLTITANSGTRVYGTPTPDFGVTYDGLVNGDTSAVVSGLTVGANTALTSKVSIYPIVPANAVAENYVIDFVNGVLVVTSPPVEIDGSQYLAATLNGDPLMTPYYVVVDIEDRDELFAIDDSVGTGPSVGDSVDAALADSTNSANFQSGWAAPSFDPDAPLDNALNEAGELFSWAKYRGEYLRSYRLPVGRDRQGFGPCLARSSSYDAWPATRERSKIKAVAKL